MPMMWGYGPSGWGWLLMAASMVAFWGLLIWAIVAIFRPGGRWGRGEARDAEQILAERFAAGEIDEPEYRARRDVLRSSTRRVGQR
jgi:putative membrane protein